MQLWEEKVMIHQDGRDQGKAEGKAEDILKVLHKYGNISEQLENRIKMEMDLKTLNKWFDSAILSDSIAQFQEQMDK